MSGGSTAAARGGGGRARLARPGRVKRMWGRPAPDDCAGRQVAKDRLRGLRPDIDAERHPLRHDDECAAPARLCCRGSSFPHVMSARALTHECSRL